MTQKLTWSRKVALAECATWERGFYPATWKPKTMAFLAEMGLVEKIMTGRYDNRYEAFALTPEGERTLVELRKTHAI